MDESLDRTNAPGVDGWVGGGASWVRVLCVLWVAGWVARSCVRPPVSRCCLCGCCCFLLMLTHSHSLMHALADEPEPKARAAALPCAHTLPYAPPTHALADEPEPKAKAAAPRPPAGKGKKGKGRR